MLEKLEARLIQAAEFNKFNRTALEKSESAACYFCCTVFNPVEINKWVNEANYNKRRERINLPPLSDPSYTAICPNCGVDAVLPSASNLDLNPIFLENMRRYWFTGGFEYQYYDENSYEVFYVPHDELIQDNIYGPYF